MPNQHSPGYPNQRSIVADYLAKNPMSLTSDIAAAIGLHPRRVAHLLFVLREEGRAIGSKQGTAKSLSWRLTEEEEQLNEGSPIRITVAQWTGHKRDELLTAFYGAAA